MKMLINISLSLLISLHSIGVNLGDLLQIDELYEHYQFHKQEYGHDLITFIELHYGKQKASHEQEHQDHKKLPFHHSHISTSSIVFYNNTSHFILKPYLINNKDLTPHFDNLYSSLLVDEILQPPRV